MTQGKVISEGQAKVRGAIGAAGEEDSENPGPSPRWNAGMGDVSKANGPVDEAGGFAS